MIHRETNDRITQCHMKIVIKGQKTLIIKIKNKSKQMFKAIIYWL